MKGLPSRTWPDRPASSSNRPGTPRAGCSWCRTLRPAHAVVSAFHQSGPLPPVVPPGRTDRALTTMSSPAIRYLGLASCQGSPQQPSPMTRDTTPTEWNLVSPGRTSTCASELCEPQAASKRARETDLQGRARLALPCSVRFSVSRAGRLQPTHAVDPLRHHAVLCGLRGRIAAALACFSAPRLPDGGRRHARS